MKPYILIVEDEPILYERLRRFLIKQDFSVSKFTKSYHEAIENIEFKKPDLVLLDINLQGDKDGIDLGEKLSKNYKIPFIYVTDFGDEVTFNRALRTNPNIFEIKTKPQIDTEHLLRSIKTVLQQSKVTVSPPQEGIMAYIDYITTEAIVINSKIIESIRTNYVRIESSSSERYFYKSSLKNLLTVLPNYFIRINESTIVNLKSKNFEGRINGLKLSINEQLFTIKETYSKEVNNRIDSFYKS